MKGKKIDSDFLSSFIEDCIKNNKLTTEDILQEAKHKISDINSKIIEVEKLKILRSKLLDVVSTFDKSIESKSNDAKLLSLFNIKNQNICKIICDLLKIKPIIVNDLLNSKLLLSFDKTDVAFAIKQLLEYKVINRTNNTLLKGDMYIKYNKMVLCNNV